MFFSVTLLGFIMPTGSQLSLMFQHKLAGTASALLGSLQFGFGAIITTVTGIYASSGSIGLISIMLICGFISALMCLFLFPKTLTNYH